jgi:biotin synthase
MSEATATYLDRESILRWLREDDPERLETLWKQADEARRAHVGDEVHLRGLIEISNFCVRQCGYCGIRAGNSGIERYRMSEDEIMACVSDAVRYGYGTVVMQGGEDYGIETAWLAAIIRRIKAETPLAITLSLGERPQADLAAWRDAGADRYLLRFETSDPELYAFIHPDYAGRASDRIAALRVLRDLGYEAGGGVMIGIPGQTYSSVADDIDLFRQLDLDMVGIGPYIPDPHTPLGRGEWQRAIPPDEQVPNTELMTCKAVSLTRLVCPQANLPSTTALATVNRTEGREHGLARGANIVMPNLTPLSYRRLYAIYPAKAGTEEAGEAYHERMRAGITKMGRRIGRGQGGRKR